MRTLISASIPLRFLSFSLVAVIIGCAWYPYASAAQSFSFAKGMVPVGKTMVYQKSNLDGSNPAFIAVFYRSVHEIEAFKWHDGESSATLVRATIDDSTMNVERFESFSVASDGEATKRAELIVRSEGDFEIIIGESRQNMTMPPGAWHSYDFDFASLGYAFRFFDHPRDGVQFHIYDLDLTTDPIQFKDFGAVEVTYDRTERYAGMQAARFIIDGPGLDNRGGFIWFSEEKRELLGFEIQKPDEPGYESGRLYFLHAEQLTDTGWLGFQVNALGG